MKTKSQAAKIRELLMKETPPKEIAEQLKVPISTVYTVRWKMKKAKPTAEVQTKVKQMLDRTKPKAKEIQRHNELLEYLIEEMEETNRLISDATAIRTYLAVRIKEAFKARAEASERA